MDSAVSELAWDRKKRKPLTFAVGVIGWATCKQCSTPAVAVSAGEYFRVHVCRANPCTAVHHPSKYGSVEPPRLHGKILRLCDEGEAVCLEKEWMTLHDQLHGEGDHGCIAVGIVPAVAVLYA